MFDHLKVSCLCVSTGRSEYLRNAIKYFFAQTHAHKELIVVSAARCMDYEEILLPYESQGIKYYYESADKPSLGSLRNLAVTKAEGEYLCIWDDDDWYHPRRIEIQLQQALIHEKKGSILPYYILFDAIEGNAYMSLPLPPPASMLCQREVISGDIGYRELERSEDGVIVHQINQMNVLFPVINPLLYIYIFHGKNTWHLPHFKQFCGKPFSSEASEVIRRLTQGESSIEETFVLIQNSSILSEFDYFNAFKLDHGASVVAAKKEM